MFLESCKWPIFRRDESNEWFRYPLRTSHLHRRNPIGSVRDQFAVVKHYPLPTVIVSICLEPKLIWMRSGLAHRLLAVPYNLGIMLDEAVRFKARFKKFQQPLLIGERQAGYCSHQLIIIHLRHYMPALFNLVSIGVILQSWQSARSTSHLTYQVYISSIKTSSGLKTVKTVRKETCPI